MVKQKIAGLVLLFMAIGLGFMFESSGEDAGACLVLGGIGVYLIRAKDIVFW